MNAVSPTSVKHTVAKSYLEKVEDALVTAAKSGVAGTVKVEAYPADPDQYDFAGLEAAVLIHYGASRFSPRESQVNANQIRRMNYSIILMVRSLRGPAGAYRVLEDLRKAFQGASFEGAGPAEIVEDKLADQQAGVWRWEMTLGLNAPAVAGEQARPAALMRPTFTEPKAQLGA